MVDKARLPADALASAERNALLNATRHGGKAEVGAVVSKLLGEFPALRPRAGEVAREARRVVDEVNALPPGEQSARLQARYPEAVRAQEEKKKRPELDPLPNAEKGKVVLRLPPEPSGFMTIGHAMAFTINFLYRETYGGKLWLRFEDTNPRRASKRYYDSFRRGIAWLGIRYDAEKYECEDNEVMYSHGRRLIEMGKAYACSCGADLVKKNRAEGRECEHREKPPGESLRIWGEMLARKHREGSYVIRYKGDMSSVDYSLRDPNIFRIIEHEHPVTGSRFVVWPTYNFANTVEDELCGVTHILRSSEFPVALQEHLREDLAFRAPEVIQFSRFNFKGTPVAKRLLRPLVEQKLVTGWDDPRMPTVDGVRRRGIIPEAIRQFTLQVGYTKAEHEYDWSLLFAVNRKLLDPVSRRFFFVPDPVRLRVEGAPAKRATIKFHPDGKMGERTIATEGEVFVARSDLASLKKGDVFRLMELYNVRLAAGGSAPKGEFAGEELTQDSRKFQWVGVEHADVKALVPGPLFDDEGNFDKGSLREVKGYVEPSFAAVKEGEIVQFPRFGFCRVDSPGTVILAHK